MVTADIPSRLRNALKAGKIRKIDLSRAAGLHRNTLLRCEDENWNPSLATLRAIEPHLPAFEPVE